jgi:hypothetical protein
MKPEPLVIVAEIAGTEASVNVTAGAAAFAVNTPFVVRALLDAGAIVKAQVSEVIVPETLSMVVVPVTAFVPLAAPAARFHVTVPRVICS